MEVVCHGVVVESSRRGKRELWFTTPLIHKVIIGVRKMIIPLLLKLKMQIQNSSHGQRTSHHAHYFHEELGYTDEPISKILSNISNSDIVCLDRWSLEVEKNTEADPNGEGKENLPLNVVNNYYSLGVDAHIALEFHEAREAHPEKFNSRLKNKMFYGQMGGKDLLKRKWRDLADFVTLECDGQNITHKLKELRVHAIVFLNIPSYGGGTRPWNRSMGSSEPSTEDGLIEVVGLTTYQLVSSFAIFERHLNSVPQLLPFNTQSNLSHPNEKQGFKLVNVVAMKWEHVSSANPSTWEFLFKYFLTIRAKCATVVKDI
ncbi:hypothetical protein NQ318_012672 [Aromia moschata]|uniref:Diacylglycerol kinase accessory domain-containing protein n=1 Tax=Aromia moschata TaxID=1265417 RepID=A0AAV8YGE7_9CUCU|nr:hypothetical protein NQ318_012672 [Aromia moschata]